MDTPLCSYCNEHSVVLVTGSVVYTHRKDLANLNFWQCSKCKAYVGTHRGTIVPLGSVANAGLRKERSYTHKVFDKLWRNTHFTRNEAYRKLARHLHIAENVCHIAMFDTELCKRTQRYAIKHSTRTGVT